MKLIMLINVKMPINVCILACISMENIPCEGLKAIITLFCQHFSFYEQLKSYAFSMPFPGQFKK